MDPLSIVAAACQLLEGAAAILERAQDYRDSAHALQQLDLQLRQLDEFESSFTKLLCRPVFKDVDTTGFRSPLAKVKLARHAFDRHFKPSQTTHGSKSRFKRTLNKRRIRAIAQDIKEAESGLILAQGLLILSIAASNISLTDSLETSSTFHPEKYVALEPVFASVYLFCAREISRSANKRTYNFYITFSHNARSCSRIIVNASITTSEGKSTETFVDDLDRPGRRLRLLPGHLLPQLESTIRSTQDELFRSSSKIGLKLAWKSQSGFQIDPSYCHIEEDLEEASHTSVCKLVPEMAASGMPHYLEKQIAKVQKLYVDAFIVIVDSRPCIQWRVPFATASGDGRNLAEGFIEDMHLLRAAQDCSHVAKFVGIVLNDDRKLIRGFLAELPAQGALVDLFIRTEREGLTISWARRLKWIHQLVSAVAEIHRRGSTVGIINSTTVWLDRNDNVSLPDFKSSPADLRGFQPALPPEFRVHRGPRFTVATDIFQLGWTIWMIAQCLVNAKRTLCQRNNCPHREPHKCREPHAMPIQLPSCVGIDIPPYIDEIIGQCRSCDPIQRSSAEKVLAQLPPVSQTGEVSATSLLNSETPQLRSHCDICNTIFWDEFYRCDICAGGNFELCPTCFLKENYLCYDKQHELKKTVRKHSIWVSAEG